jgi:pyruvate kinase
MPNQLADGTVRVSYVEDSETLDRLREVQKKAGVSLSVLVRIATKKYLEEIEKTRRVELTYTF